MRQIVYDVAMTVDGFVCHADGSCHGFVEDGGHLADYLARLEQYDAVLMGRKTYEYGYEFGLKPGERAYPHMEHYIFSDTLEFDSDRVKVIGRDRIETVRELKQTDGGTIYLCGGGTFAAFLLEHELIDRMVIKLNPIVIGNGIRAFANSSKQVTLTNCESKAYENGVTLLEYDIDYQTR